MSELLRAPSGSTQLKRARNPIRYRLYSIKAKCKKLNIEFNIDETDIKIPSHCPLLELPLIRYSDYKEHGASKDRKHLWSIDRKDPTKGYVKGNVWVVSLRANTIKNDATLEELELLTDNLRKESSRR